MIKNYSGNRKPFLAVLCSEKDLEEILPVLEIINSSGRNLCILSENSLFTSPLKKACAVIAVISENFFSSSVLTDALILSDSLDKEIVPVRLCKCSLPGAAERILMARNSIMADNYSNSDELAKRIMTANAISAPFITKHQKTAMKVAFAAAIIAAVVIIAATALGIHASQSKNVLPDYITAQGLTIEDLEKISRLIYVGDNSYEASDYSDVVYLESNGDVHEWKDFENNQVISKGTISDFSFLKYCTNLRSLTLINQSCEDFPDLSSLENLAIVEIYDCSFINLDGLRSTNLTYLAIGNTPIGSLDFINDLPMLSELEISDLDNIVSLDGADFDSIKNLTIKRCNIKDFSALKTAENITYLVAEELDASDFSFLGSLTSLSNLEIISCENLKTISSLENTSGLVHLSLIDIPNFDGDLSCLKNHNRIRSLNLSCEVKDIDFFDNLKGAYNFELCLGESFHGDYSKLKKVGSYTKLSICTYDFSELSTYLADLTVSNFELNCTDKVDLSCLPKCQSVILTNVNINDLQGIKPLTSISLYNVASLTSLKGLESSNASEVSINGCLHLEDYSSLYNLKLSRLSLSNLFYLPDFSMINFLRSFSIELTSIYGLNDIDFMEDIHEKCIACFKLVTDDSDTSIKDLSVLENFNREEYLSYSVIEVSPCFEKYARQLVNNKVFASCQISDGQSGIYDFELTSLDDIDIFPDSLLSSVNELNILGNTVFDWGKYDMDYDQNTNRSYLRSKTGGEDIRDYAEGTLEDFSYLSVLTGLNHLHISDQPLKSLEGIQYMQNLESLTLSDVNNISDFSALYTLDSLRQLNLNNTSIDDLSGISNMRSLERICLSNDFDITDLTPLIEVSSLSEVVVSENMNSAIESLEGKDYSFNLIIE